MQRIFYILALLAVVTASGFGKTKAERQQIPMSTWHLSDKTGVKNMFKIDTVSGHFANWTPMTAYSIANSYNGTWGSPLESKIWMDRTEKTDFTFMNPYDAYYISEEELPFFDTKTPFAQLRYQTYGFNQTKEDNFDALFSVNATKKFNISALVDYMRGMGMYSNQATKQVKIGVWGYYDGKRYNANLGYMYQQFDNEENGGISSMDYVRKDNLHPDNPVQIPVNLNNEAQSRVRSHYVFLNQKAHLALKKTVKDSGKIDYKPIFSVFHTLKYQQLEKRYREDVPDSVFYGKYVFATTLDSARQRTLKNYAGVSLDEGFSKYVPFSLAAYAGHEWTQHRFLKDSTKTDTHIQNDILVGAEISKTTGRNLFFNGNAEVYLAGELAGDLKLNGNVSTVFPVKQRDTITFTAGVKFTELSANYWNEHYVSNYTNLTRNNNFDKILRLKVTARAGWQNKWVNIGLGGGFENLNNYVYYGTGGNPTQYGKAIQVINARADVNLRAWFMHLDNSVVWQQTSSPADVFDLPVLSSYNNIYALFTLFKVLKTQIGVDCYYNTSYYAPRYMPATGAFYAQTDEKVGNYPVLTAYVNFHLYTARFYFKYYHFNESFMNREYFSMPDYPLYEGRFQMGLAWNFFD